MDTVIILIVAYLIGSIPSGLWIGQLFFKTDIRTKGSGNLGSTNSFRVLGKKAGSVVLVMDIFKGTFATILPIFAIFSETNVHPLVLGIVAVFGHMFPVFAGFRGGKAVATSAGVLLGYHWPIFIIIILAFLLCLKFFKMVSLASLFGTVVAEIYAIIFFFTDRDYLLLLITSCLFIFVFYRHRSNIKRIKAGTEPKVNWI